jgi:ABC-type transport system involved in multi-copper enzyme maturation permease subunit
MTTEATGMTVEAPTFGGTRRSAAREFVAAVGTIMVKELRSRMRGRRAFVVLTAYLAILALITYGVYVIAAQAARDQIAFGGGMVSASALIGQWIFILLSIFQVVLVCFIAPAFTAGQISLEREKQTLDLLISTPLRPGAIVVGKLLAALAFVVLMIISALPISAIVLMYGGAAVDDLLRQQLVLLVTALGLGSIGLFYSALLKRTQAATVLTYITMLALTVGTVMLFIFWSVLLVINDTGGGFGRQPRAPEQLMWVNPGVAIADVIAYTDPSGFLAQGLAQLRGQDPGVFGPVTGGAFAEEVVCRGNVCEPVPVPVDQFGNAIAQAGGAPAGGYWWPRFSITFFGLSALLTLASMRFVVPAGMRWAFRRRRLPPPAPAKRPIIVGPGGPEGTATIEEVPEAKA